MTNHVTSPVNPRHLSLTTEHYTPPDIIAAARTSLVAIDLDPASSARGNTVVKAKKFFTAEDNGFLQAWPGRVFLNCPGGKCDVRGVTVVSVDKSKRAGKSEWTCDLVGKGPCGHAHQGVRSSQKAWWRKTVKEWTERRTTAALFVGFSLEILQVAQVFDADERPGSVPSDFPHAIPSTRLKYWTEKIIAGPEGERVELVESDSPPHASVLIFLPPQTADQRFHIDAFEKAFAYRGRVVVPKQWILP